jgi:hypothetical protein
MEIGAHLSRLELLASDPHALARFYASTFRLQPTQDGDTVTCSAPERQLVFVRGEGGQLLRAAFRFHERASFEAHRDFVRERGVETLERHAAAYTVRDPVGHLITFQTPAEAPRAEPSDPTFAAWGIGRHGPGNDTFLMVKDMDGNMGEISSDLEVCVPGRPAGIWPHQPQTLNRWGVAIMRS